MLRSLLVGPHRCSDRLYHDYPKPRDSAAEWHAFGIALSSGQRARRLTEGHAGFHAQAQALLRAGLEVSTPLHVDDTSAPPQGKNG